MKEKIARYVKSNKHLMGLALRLKRKKKKSIVGNNNKIINDGVLLNIIYDIHGNDNTITIKKGTVISDTKIYIRGNHHHLLIDSNCKYKGGSFYFEDDHCRIEIQEGTTVESAHLAVTEPGKKIIIGKNCMLSTNIEFRTGDSHSILETNTNKRINYAQDIEVENNVWIGANATILKGVKIGPHSIIASGAIVTANVPANSIAGGIPAKIVKSDVYWLRERIYENNN